MIGPDVKNFVHAISSMVGCQTATNVSRSSPEALDLPYLDRGEELGARRGQSSHKRILLMRAGESWRVGKGKGKKGGHTRQTVYISRP